MGIAQHEYLKFHVGNIISNHYLVADFANRSWVAYHNNQSLYYILFAIAPMYDIVVLSFKCWP